MGDVIVLRDLAEQALLEPAVRAGLATLGIPSHEAIEAVLADPSRIRESCSEEQTRYLHLEMHCTESLRRVRASGAWRSRRRLLVSLGVLLPVLVLWRPGGLPAQMSAAGVGALALRGLYHHAQVRSLRRAFRIDETLQGAREALDALRQSLRSHGLRYGFCELINERFNGPSNPGLSSLGLDGALRQEAHRPEHEVRTKAFNKLQDWHVRAGGGKVGVTGPPGSGRSTLAQSLGGAQQILGTQRLQVMVSAGGIATTRDLALLILNRLHSTVDDSEVTPERFARENRLALRRMLLLRSGSLLFVVSLPGLMVAMWRSGQPDWLHRFDPTIGEVARFMVRQDRWLIIATAGVALAAALWVVGVRSETPRVTRPRDLRAWVKKVYRDALFEEARSATKGVEFSYMGAAAKVSEATTIAAPARSATDLAKMVEAVISRIVAERRLIISMDHLDDLAAKAPGELMSMIRSLPSAKGLLWLVVVPDHLRRISKQNIFDTVISIEPFSPVESFEFLKKRVLGVSPHVGVLCHTLSGGLPSQLLPLAREVAQQTRVQEAPTGMPQACALVIDERLHQEVGNAQTDLQMADCPRRTRLVRWMQDQAIRTPDDLLGLIDACRNYRSQVEGGSTRLPGAAERQVIKLGRQLVAFLYLSFTLAEFLRRAAGRDLVDPSVDVDALARAQRGLRDEPALAWETVSRFREHRKLIPVAQPFDGDE